MENKARFWPTGGADEECLLSSLRLSGCFIKLWKVNRLRANVDPVLQSVATSHVLHACFFFPLPILPLISLVTCRPVKPSCRPPRPTHASVSVYFCCPKSRDCCLCRKPDGGRREIPGLQTRAPPGVSSAWWSSSALLGGRERDHIWHIFQRCRRLYVATQCHFWFINRWNCVFLKEKWKTRERWRDWPVLAELLSLNGCFNNSSFRDYGRSNAL